MQSKLNALAFTILRDSQASDMERQAKLQHAAHYWKDQHTGHTSNPADYTWLEFDLPPTYFNEMSQSDWEKWFKDEVDMWREEGRPNRFDDMKAPIREAVVAMPGQLAALVNPTDPVHARGHLERWRDDFLKTAKARLPLGPDTTT